MPGGAGGSLQLLFQINADDKGAEAALKKLEQELGLLQGSMTKLLPVLQQNSGAILQYTVNTNTATTATKNFGAASTQAASQASGLGAAIQSASRSFQSSAGGIQQVVSALGGLTGAGGGLANIVGQFTKLGSALGPAGLAIGALASLGAGLVETTNKAAETGEQILQLSQRTGLSTEAISGLRVAATLTNTSIETMATAFQRFRARIVSSVEGVRDNQEALARLGINGPAALRNMDSALDQLIKQYDRTGDSARKAQVLQDAFGARIGNQLTPIIDEAGGSLKALVKQADDLNQVWSADQAKQMNQYADTMKRLSLSVEGLGRTVSQFLVGPFTVLATIIQQGLASPKKFLEDLSADINEGALTTGLFTHVLETAVGQIAKDIPKAAREGGHDLIEVNKDLERQLTLEQKAAQELRIEQVKNQLAERLDKLLVLETKEKESLKRGEENYDDYVDKIVDINFRRASAEKQAAFDIRDIRLESVKVPSEDLLEKERFNRAQADAERKRLAADQAVRDEAADQLAKDNAKLARDRAELEKKITDLIEDGRHWAVEAQIAFGKAFADALEPPEDIGGGMATQIEQAAADARKALDPLIEKFRELKVAVIETGRSITEDLAEGAGVKWEDAAHKQIDLSGSLTTGLSKLAKDGFKNFSNAMGETVKQWVLLGHTGPAVMRKMLAETLATLAQQATVEALYWTAYGFAMLATHQYKEAGDAFTAAAIFAAVAVGSALVGRAIAPKEGGSATSNTVSQMTPPNTSINVGGTTATLAQTPGQAFGAFADSINKLNGKLDSMSPGDVVTKAADTTPGAFATGVTNATQKDGSFRRQLGLTLLPST